MTPWQIRLGRGATALLVLAVLARSSGAAQPPTGGPVPPSRQICPSAEEIQAQIKPLSQIKAGLNLDVSEIPTDCSQSLFSPRERPVARSRSVIEFHWQPSDFFHQPLYFDDTPLERYGQSICPTLQPVISGARFVATIPAIPYKIGVDHTHDCVTTLGKYRPDGDAPCVHEVLPLELDAALLEAGTAIAIALLVP